MLCVTGSPLDGTQKSSFSHFALYASPWLASGLAETREQKACGREGLGGAGPRERSAKPRAPRNRQRPASVAHKVLNCLELETMVASVGRWGRQSAHGLPLPANDKEGQTKGKAFAPASWAWLALREWENVPFHFCVR